MRRLVKKEWRREAFPQLITELFGIARHVSETTLVGAAFGPIQEQFLYLLQQQRDIKGVGALMEKPLNLPSLLKTIPELFTEGSETHLKELMGLRGKPRYAPPLHKRNRTRG